MVSLTEHTELYRLCDVLFKILNETPKQGHKSTRMSHGSEGGFGLYLLFKFFFITQDCFIKTKKTLC